MEMLFVVLVFCLPLYMMIFHTEKYKEINEMGFNNVRRTTGGLVKAGRMGYKAYRMFKK
jgi:hypothetical protein